MTRKNARTGTADKGPELGPLLLLAVALWVAATRGHEPFVNTDAVWAWFGTAGEMVTESSNDAQGLGS